MLEIDALVIIKDAKDVVSFYNVLFLTSSSTFLELQLTRSGSTGSQQLEITFSPDESMIRQAALKQDLSTAGGAALGVILFMCKQKTPF